MKIQGGYKNIRLEGFDYTNGWFFITNKTDFSHYYLNGDIRTLVKQELIALAQKTSGVGIDYFHIMSNHIHVILIFQDAELALPEIWRRFKAITTLKAKRLGFQERSLWQKNYFEHIIRNEHVLQKIRDYIRNNPLKANLPIQEFYDEVKVEV